MLQAVRRARERRHDAFHSFPPKPGPLSPYFHEEANKEIRRKIVKRWCVVERYYERRHDKVDVV